MNESEYSFRLSFDWSNSAITFHIEYFMGDFRIFAEIDDEDRRLFYTLTKKNWDNNILYADGRNIEYRIIKNKFHSWFRDLTDDPDELNLKFYEFTIQAGDAISRLITVRELMDLDDLESMEGRSGDIEFFERNDKQIVRVKVNGEFNEFHFRYILRGRFFNAENNKLFYLCQKNGEPTNTIISTKVISKILRDEGANQYQVNKILNYIANENFLPELQTFRNYGYEEEINHLIFPQSHIATNLIGFGLDFFELFVNNEEHYQEGRDIYFNMLKCAESGIGKTQAVLIAAFSIASPFQHYFKQKIRIIPELLLIGDPDTAKTTAAEKLGDIGNFKILHAQEELTHAIFSQLGSVAPIPMVIDDVDKLKEDVVNHLKIVLTGASKRRRLTSDGERRDAAEFIRTIIMMANGIPDFLEEDTAPMDRTIVVSFDKIPESAEEWKVVQQEFDDCPYSFINYLIHSNLNFNEILNNTYRQIEEIEKLRKKSIYNFILFGINILKESGYDIDGQTIEEIRDLVFRSN
ncbi:MAG: hypothetical protein ACTSRP_03270 [Candidatus Helarchaeota archaeon]